MLPDRVRAMTKLLAFAPDGKISQERLNLFRDAFGEIDAKAIEDILTYSDMGAKKGAGIIYEDANMETQLSEAEQEAADVLKILSTEVGTVFYVTEQFETGTYLAANVMAVKKGDLAGGVAQTILHRVYYITKRLNPKAGKSIKELVQGELKQRYTAEAYAAAVEQIRKEMVVSGNDVSRETAEEELCAREFPTIIMEGAAMEQLVAADKDAVNLIRKSLRAVQEHLSDEVTLSAVKGRVTFDGVDQSKLNERQRATVKALSVGFGAMGINVEFFESPVNAAGQHVGINGSYDPATNTVRLDIAAGIKGEDAILFTASHELTHFIKEWSGEKYQVFTDFLLQKYAERGVDVESLIQAKIEASKKSSAYAEPLSREAALEEVVCDSCETFLRDSNLMESLTELAKKDQTLFERVKEFFQNLLEDLRRVYRGLMPDSAEANIVLEMTDSIEELHAMWEDAALSARENALQSGMEVQKNTTEGGVKYAVKKKKKEHYWRTGFSNAEFWDLVGIVKYELGKPTGYIDNDNKWLYNNRKGYFAIYSTIYKDDPTILYASKGKKAEKERLWFCDFIDEVGKEMRENGRNDSRGEIVDEILASYGYVLGKSGVYSRINADKRGDNGNVRLHSESSRFRPSRALLNCIENIAQAQSRSGVKKSDRFLGEVDLPTTKTNELYHRLTALVRGEEAATDSVGREVDFDIDSYADQEFAYSDAEQVRAENDGAESAKNFEDMTPEEQAAEIADLQSEIDAIMTADISEQLEREEGSRESDYRDPVDRVGAKRERQKEPWGKTI